MRFVHWNCCEGFARDLPALLDLKPDLAVLCEVPRDPPDSGLFGPSIDWHAAGTLERKSLVIAGFDASLRPVEPPPGAGRWSLGAVHASSGMGILGLWSTPEKSSAQNYAKEVALTVDAYEPFLRERPSLVAGDFNMSPNGSADQSCDGLRKVFDALGKLGYVSVYHHTTGEAYGDESKPTYFHRRRESEPFHIDFVFAHESLLPRVDGLEVGTYQQWVERQGSEAGLSDHVPLIVDIAEEGPK